MNKRKIRKGKQFHSVKHFRISEENLKWLREIKRGTWNNTFNTLRSMTPFNKEQLEEAIKANTVDVRIREDITIEDAEYITFEKI